MATSRIIDTTKAQIDNNGIWVGSLDTSPATQTSKKAWENIYNFTLDDLYRDKAVLAGNKLEDHMRYVESSYAFSSKTVYLEIGCGPGHIGVELMRKHNICFVGVDFNYPMLIVLREFFRKEGFSNYVLIHADITNMPIAENAIDYIYGGGVIEHLSDTQKVLKECYRVLAKNGVCFNTVPAFNLWWPVRWYRNIPSLFPLRPIFEFIHYRIFGGRILEKNFGYELSYVPIQLRLLHKKVGFVKVEVGAFSFHLALFKQRRWLNHLIYVLTDNIFLSPVYYISAKK